MKTSTLKQALAMMPVSSADQTRYHICGVRMRNVDGGVELHATEGHMAFTTVVDDKLPDGDYILKRDNLAAAKLVYKEMAKIDDIPCDIDADKNMLFGHFTKARIYKCEGYLDISQVIPKSREGFAVVLNAGYLLELAKALHFDTRKTAAGNSVVRLIFPANDGAIRVEYDGNDRALGVLMPCRDKKSAEITKAFLGKEETKA